MGTQQRKSLIVANWKMHLGMQQASLYAQKLADKIKVHQDVEVVLAPTTLTLQSLSLQVNRRQFKLAAQNCYWRDEGAFTGEVSAAQLRGIADYVIVGHSERRHVFNERDRDTTHKVQAVIRNKMKPILCIGETAREKADGEASHVLHDQLVGGLLNVVSDEISSVVVAYEPVWAISNGKDFSEHEVPTGDSISKVVKLIRKQIKALYGIKASEDIQILYGGSVTAADASSFLAIDGIDGLLIGGASLKADDFASIVELAHDTQLDKQGED